jgi:hypothetical protein
MVRLMPAAGRGLTTAAGDFANVLAELGEHAARPARRTYRPDSSLVRRCCVVRARCLPAGRAPPAGGKAEAGVVVQRHRVGRLSCADPGGEA